MSEASSARRFTPRALVRRAPVTARLAALVAAGGVVALVTPWIILPLGLSIGRTFGELHLYTLVTYAFVGPTPAAALWMAGVLLLFGQVVEPRLGRRGVLTLAAAALVLGGTMYALVLSGTVIVGARAIGAAFAGAFIACWARHRHEHGWLPAVVSLYLVLAMLASLFGEQAWAAAVDALVAAVAGTYAALRTRSAVPRADEHPGTLQGVILPGLRSAGVVAAGVAASLVIVLALVLLLLPSLFDPPHFPHTPGGVTMLLAIEFAAGLAGVMVAMRLAGHARARHGIAVGVLLLLLNAASVFEANATWPLGPGLLLIALVPLQTWGGIVLGSRLLAMPPGQPLQSLPT